MRSCMRCWSTVFSQAPHGVGGLSDSAREQYDANTYTFSFTKQLVITNRVPIIGTVAFPTTPLRSDWQDGTC